MTIFQKDRQDNCRENTVNKVVEIPISSIVPNPAQPRVIFDDYELIAGERRLRACRLLNMSFVPCIVISASEKDSAVLAVLENLQRADLSFMEEAYAIKNLIDYYGLTQEETAARLGTAQSTIANKLRLLKLSDEEKSLVVKYKLTERQARALLRLESEKRPEAIHYIASNQLNTSQTDSYIDELIKGKHKQKIQRRWSFRAVNLYINTFNRTIDAMKEAGINCETVKNRTDDFVEYVVKIPLKQMN